MKSVFKLLVFDIDRGSNPITFFLGLSMIGYELNPKKFESNQITYTSKSKNDKSVFFDPNPTLTQTYIRIEKSNPIHFFNNR